MIDFKDSLWNNVTKYLLISDNSCEKNAVQKRLLILLLLEDIVDWVLLTLSITCPVKANLVEMLNSRTPIFCFSILPVMWCKTARLLHSWVADQASWLLLRRNVCTLRSIVDWLVATDRRKNRLLHKHWFHSSTILCPWTQKAFKSLYDEHKNLFFLHAFQSFSHKFKNHFLQCCPKEFNWFPCNCVINLLKWNLQNIKGHHVFNFQSAVHQLFLKRTTWNQKSDILPSDKGLQLLKVITLPIITRLSWHGAVCPDCCFCIQQKFRYPVSYKAWISKVSTKTKSHVQYWYT